MAKQTLSDKQRGDLRKEIKKRASAGEALSELISSLSSKFKVTGETIRYYVKTVGVKAKKSLRGRKPKSKAGRKPKAAPKAKAKRGRTPKARRQANRNGASKTTGLVALAQQAASLSSAKINQVLRAGKLLKRKEELVEVKNALSGKLKQVTASIGKLEKKIRKALK